MFLKSITINNFRSIQKATANFENGLNIIIGKNGVGKSNLLTYINQNLTLQRLFNRLRNLKISNLDYNFIISDDAEIDNLSVSVQKDKIIENNEIAIVSVVELSDFKNGIQIRNQTFEIKSSDNISANTRKEFRSLTSKFGELHKAYVTYEIPKEEAWLNMPSKLVIDIGLDIEFEDWPMYSFIFQMQNNIELKIMTYLHDGDNGYAKPEDVKIDDIKQAIFESFEQHKETSQIKDFLGRYSPIEDLRLNTNINIYFSEGRIHIENLLLEFNTSNSWVPYNHLSDGTKRLFYLISECISTRDGDILLIEEPELGIHPHQFFLLMNFIKEQSLTKQVIMSTHSPMALDILKPEELNRITIAKLDANGTKFEKLDSAQKETAVKYIEEVGELSYYWLHSNLENE